MPVVVTPSPPKILLERYEVLGEIASGGMATVYAGRMVGPVGFSRSVAIKRLHPHLAKEADFVAMFIDEARLAARIRHPNVVPTLDVVATDDDLFLVMEYVEGESLARVLELAAARFEPVPVPIAAAIMIGVLYGLHAAHEATGEDGKALGLVHRDVSPQNIIVGFDGIARVLDFGIAKAQGRLHTTKEGRLKGKLAYMAPEHVKGERLTRAADIYSASVVLWEALAGKRLFEADNDATLLEMVLHGDRRATSSRGATPLDRIVNKGLRLDPAKRFSTARAMAREIERVTHVASASDLSEWIEAIHGSGPRPSLLVPTPTSTVSKPRRTRKALFIVALVAASIAGLAIAGWFLVRLRFQQPRTPAVVSALPFTTPPASSAIASVSAMATAEPKPEAPSRTLPAPKGPHIIPDARRQACNPPYVVDGQGVKHYKVECL